MEAWREELYHWGVKGMKWGKHKSADAVTLERLKNAGRMEGLATQAIRGNLGNGAARQRALGGDYYQVQTRVNQRVAPGRNLKVGNYATSGESAQEYSQRLRKQANFRRQMQEYNAAKRRQSTSSQKSEPKEPSGNGRSKAYNAGYNLIKNLFGGKKKKSKRNK